MRNIYIREFMLAVEALEPIKQRLSIAGIKPVKQPETNAIRNALVTLYAHCEYMKLESSTDQLRRIEQALDQGIATSRLLNLLEGLRERILDELPKRAFYQVATESLWFYHPDPDERAKLVIRPLRLIVGDEVYNAFPSTHYDLDEAIKAKIAVRYTACVFHMMRVLEVGLRVFAARFKVSTDQANWGTMIDQIEKAIRDIASDPNKPANWKEERAYYSEIASNFAMVKDAWRNHVAHGNKRYEEGEADSIFRYICQFMNKLAFQFRE